MSETAAESQGAPSEPQARRVVYCGSKSLSVVCTICPSSPELGLIKGRLLRVLTLIYGRSSLHPSSRGTMDLLEKPN